MSLHRLLVRMAGFEPATFALSAHCSNQLSYTRIFKALFQHTQLLDIVKVNNEKDLLYKPFLTLYIYYIKIFIKNQLKFSRRYKIKIFTAFYPFKLLLHSVGVGKIRTYNLRHLIAYFLFKSLKLFAEKSPYYLIKIHIQTFRMFVKKSKQKLFVRFYITKQFKFISMVAQ